MPRGPPARGDRRGTPVSRERKKKRDERRVRAGPADAATILLVSLLTATRGLALAVAAGIVATSLRFAYARPPRGDRGRVRRATDAPAPQDSANDLYSSHESVLGVRTVDLHGTLFFGSSTFFKDHVAPTQADRGYAKSWRRKWLKRTVVLDFLHCRVCDASAINAIDEAIGVYRALGLTVVLRHLSRDASLLLRASAAQADLSDAVLFDERDDDPSYYVAATTPDRGAAPPLKPDQLVENREKGQTVIVAPEGPPPRT